MDKLYCLVILACVFLFSMASNLSAATEFSDPMRPLDYRVSVKDMSNESADEQKKTDSWKLTAVLLSEKRTVAVINGRSLQPGDTLEGYTLTSIQEDRVTLNGKGRKLVLQRTGTGLKKKLVPRK